MSENLRNFTTAVSILRNVAVRVPDDAWDNPSCCEEWTAREVAGHASWVLQNIAASATDGPPPAQQPEAEVAGDDPAATVVASVDGVLAALDHQGALQKMAQTPFGEMPMDAFIGTIGVDPLTHAWDIADAAGIESGIDDATAAAAHQALTPIAGALRGSGRFADEKAPASDGALDRFVAFAGRTSVRA